MNTVRHLSTETTAVLAFAFGMAISTTDRPVGLLAAIHDTLDMRNELDDLIDRLDPFMAARIRQAIILDRAAARKRP